MNILKTLLTHSLTHSLNVEFIWLILQQRLNDKITIWFVLNRKLESLSYTTMALKPVSYRQNCDYSKQFKWTYELNEDLHRCYNKARNDPRIGYMNRFKSYWNEIHPELSNFTSKNLYVIKQVELRNVKPIGKLLKIDARCSSTMKKW